MTTNIHWTESAVDDLSRLRDFLKEKNPSAAQSVARALIGATELLARNPDAGKPVLDMLDDGNYRDLHIPFGVSGYTLRYRHENQNVYILQFKHQRERNFRPPDATV